jgi:hypothetical protein
MTEKIVTNKSSKLQYELLPIHLYQAISEGLSRYEIRTGNGPKMFTIFTREAGYSTEDQEITGSLDRDLRHIPHISWR